jgi:hypothetical protein
LKKKLLFKAGAGQKKVTSFFLLSFRLSGFVFERNEFLIRKTAEIN